MAAVDVEAALGFAIEAADGLAGHAQKTTAAVRRVWEENDRLRHRAPRRPPEPDPFAGLSREAILAELDADLAARRRRLRALGIAAA